MKKESHKSYEAIYVVKVNDGFCEWKFELGGNGKYCIQDIIDAICKQLELQEVNSELIGNPELMGGIGAKE